MIYRRTHDLAMIVYEQLPRAIKGSFTVAIQTDPFELKPIATFTHVRDQRVWSCVLQTTTVEGVEVRCVVPEVFLAQLSMVA